MAFIFNHQLPGQVVAITQLADILTDNRHKL